MSLLTIIQDAANEIGISEPTSVIGNTDVQIKQLLALANNEGKSLSSRPAQGWQNLIYQATFTTVALELQGTVESIAPGYRYILNQTIWNRSTRRPVYGPIDPQDWQLLKASPVTGPFDQYRIRQGQLLFNPIPTAGQTCAFEYMTKQWCESVGGTGQARWMLDTDVGRIDEDLMKLGLIWRWKKTKNFDYAEDFAEYERQVADAIARDGTKPILTMGGGITDFQPGVFVPQTGFGS